MSSATVNFVTSSMRLPGLGMRFVRGVVTTAASKQAGVPTSSEAMETRRVRSS